MREALNPPREEPDERNCLTRPVEAAWLNHQPLVSHCLVNNEECRYSLSFAYGYLCKHPRHLEFASRPPRTGGETAGRPPAALPPLDS